MKQRIFLITAILLLTMLSARGQQAQVAQIRKAYAEAKAQIAENGNNGKAPLDMTITVNDGTEVDEDFVINEEQEMTFYFNKHRVNADPDSPEASTCYFIVVKWSANGHSSYREILLDPNKGTLLFSFTKSETHAGYVTETRFYYDAQGNVVEQKQKAGNEEVEPGSVMWMDASRDKATAAALLNIFDLVMNPGRELTERSKPLVKTAPKADRLKTIRSTYAAAKDKIAKDDKADVQHNVQIVVHDQSWGPPQIHTVNYYCDQAEPDAESAGQSCYFISERIHHNNMGPDIYNEYLLAPKSHDLIFSYTNAKEEGEQFEWRYYFDENGKCIETMTNSDTQDGGKEDKDRVRKLVMIFQKITD